MHERKDRDVDAEHVGLTFYLDAVGRHRRLDVETERRDARRLVALRREVWRVVLCDPARLPVVVDRLRARVHDPTSLSCIDALATELGHDAGARAEEPTATLRVRIETLADLLTHSGVDTNVAERLVVPNVDDDDATFADWRAGVVVARTAYLSARARFVAANLRLVVALAARRGRNRLPFADRVQEGNMGLLRAADRFDPERGVRFSTFAGWWIRHSINRALARHGRLVRVPLHVQMAFAKLRAVEPKLRAALGRDPSDAELADAIGVARAQLDRVRDAMAKRSVSLDDPLASSPFAEVEQQTDDDVADVGTRLDRERNATLATLALSGLDANERDILHHRFGLADTDETTLQALGLRYGLSRERIRQLQNRALAKLRRVVESSPTPSCAFAMR